MNWFVLLLKETLGCVRLCWLTSLISARREPLSYNYFLLPTYPLASLSFVTGKSAILELRTSSRWKRREPLIYLCRENLKLTLLLLIQLWWDELWWVYRIYFSLRTYLFLEIGNINYLIIFLYVTLFQYGT